MKRYKKRTIALVLASVITVVGAFGSENYKNNLMSLGFSNDSSDCLTLAISTTKLYENQIKPIQRDNNTYEILLPETNSKLSADLPLGKNVASIDVKTLPYTQSSIGYTKITIVMQKPQALLLKSSVYIEDKTKPAPQLETTKEYVNTPPQENQFNQAKQVYQDRPENNYTQTEKSVETSDSTNIKNNVKQIDNVSTKNVKPINNTAIQNDTPSHNEEIIKFVLGGLLVFIILIYLFVRTREKMVEITGEQLDLKLDDDKDNNNKKREKEQKPKVKTTIKKLDRTYKNPISMPIQQAIAEPEETEVETPNIIDLDKLLKEQTQQPKEENVNSDTITEDADENLALEEFLNAYNFSDNDDEENDEINEEDNEKNSFNEQLYEKYINNNNLNFSNDDVEKISLLMNTEISDEVLKNPENYLSSEIKPVKPSPTKLLENVVTSYAVNQNITFSKADIETLKSLMSVELDNDFITNLKTNPARREEMQKEFKQQSTRPHKTSELLTLNVKDLLPDLSEALKKQGNKRIESEAKPQVVYFSQGYDVSTLKLDDNVLPDLSKEINNEEAYKKRASDSIEVSDNLFDIQTMAVNDDLPDLADMLKNPEKYETTEEQKPEKIDEDALLKNIMNVTFKPFDDNRNYEVINNTDDDIEEDTDKNIDIETPTMSEIQDEFKLFDENFEIIEEEEPITMDESDADDFESLYDDNYIDLDDENSDEEIKLVEPPKSEAQKLLDQIKNAEKLRKEKAETQQNNNLQEEKLNKVENKEKETLSKPEFCILNDERYSIISVNYFTDKMGCYLAKNDNGFCVIGFAGDKIYKIKTYELLENANMQSRISKQLDNGASRYIVRIGIHKFILNVDKDNMEFVMDLC